MIKKQKILAKTANVVTRTLQHYYLVLSIPQQNQVIIIAIETQKQAIQPNFIGISGAVRVYHAYLIVL